MSDIALRRLAWGIMGVSALFAASALALILAGLEAPYSGWGFRGFPSLFSLAFTTTGILILNRLPRHGIGWVFLSLGLVSSLQGILFEYMLYSLVLYPGRLPGGLFIAWLLNSFWIVIIFLIALTLLLFPDGRLSSPRWRFYMFTLGFLVLLLGAFNAALPGPMDSSIGDLQNPYALEALRPYENVMLALSVVVMLYAFGPPLVSLVRRFRGAQGVARQQYKWFVYAAALLLVTGVVAGPSENFWVQSTFIFAIFLLPVALGIAVLRYRLFDIDIIIRRTLSYAALTGALAAVYFGGVVLMQEIFRTQSGQADSPLITVVSTLAIAALFNPLRTRIQDFIDRRFYRAKYDAERILAQFSARARDEVDIESLSAALLSAIHQAMQPEQVTLWLDGEPGHRR